MLTGIVAAAGLPGGFLPAAGAAPETVCEAAQPRALPAKVPAGSAVCFSSRWQRPLNATDPHDTFRDAARFHATHLLWAYVRDPEFIREARRRGYVFQASLNTILSGTPAGFRPEEGRILDRDGNLLTAPWMQGWKDTWWGCVNSDAFRAVYLHHAKVAIAGGTDLLQQDDPGFNVAAVAWGGCHCPHCRAGLEAFRQDHPQATMLEYQERSLEAFYAAMWAAIDGAAGTAIPRSCNNYRGQWNAYHRLFDFGVAELPDVVPEAFIESQKAALREGKAQAFTAVTDSLAGNRQAIAMAYATGATLIVPWDVYMGTGKPRFFGQPEQYADLYGLVRGCAEVLDGYEHAGVFSAGDTVDSPYDGAPPVMVLGSSRVFASVRAVPGGSERPVAIHLVDWSGKPEPFDLLLRPERFFADRPLRCELWTPAPYEEGSHSRAAETKDYGSLVQKRAIAAGAITQVSIDRIEPYGILVLSPLQPETALVWQPTVGLAGLDESTVRVELTSLTPGAQIRYWLDALPQGDGRLYEQPLAIDRTTVLSARALHPERQPSALVRLRLRNLHTGLAMRAPNSAGLADHLKLWLRAEDVRPAQDGFVAVWPAAAGPSIPFVVRRLPDGRASTPPQVAPAALNGRPALRFARETDLLSLPGFATQTMAGKAFTVFVVSQSADPEFGLAGNGVGGGGGIPRLYLLRNSFMYDQISPAAMVQASAPGPMILVYAHDGKQTIQAFRGAQPQGVVQGRPPVADFGSGGALAMPFWVGNRPRLGDVAEIVVFDRELAAAERLAVVAYLDRRYGLGAFPRWAAESVRD
jgi:hypothetical protein